MDANKIPDGCTVILFSGEWIRDVERTGPGKFIGTLIQEDNTPGRMVKFMASGVRTTTTAPVVEPA